MTTKLILSIDFDFFVKEDRALDISHGDSTLYNEMMWALREQSWKAHGKTVKELLPMVGHPCGFAYRTEKRFPYAADVPGAFSETHLAIIEYLDKFFPKQEVEIINFDAHHDIAYNGDPVATFHGEKPNCGNWVLWLMLNQRLSNYTLVYPDWRREHPEPSGQQIFDLVGKEDARLPIAHTYWSDWLKGRTKRKVDGIFICRSGPWVPPCYDEDFNLLVLLLTGHRNALEPRACNLPTINTLASTLASMTK